MILRIKILKRGTEGGRTIRAKRFDEMLRANFVHRWPGIAGRSRGHGNVKRSPKLIRFQCCGSLHQQLIVPPDARVHGEACLKKLRSAQQCMQREQSAERMADEDPVRLSAVFS